MPEGAQLVYTDNPGAIPASYEIPAGMALRLSSVVARFNAAAAAAAFIPCLSLYSQDGRLVGRYRPTKTLAVGDTGVVTYAPF